MERKENVGEIKRKGGEGRWRKKASEETERGKEVRGEEKGGDEERRIPVKKERGEERRGEERRGEDTCCGAE